MKAALALAFCLASCLTTASASAQWTTDIDGAAFLTSVSATGPQESPHEVFSTNWLAARAERPLGGNARIAFRVRGSLEPLTIKDNGYPQLFQVVSAESGGPLVNRMRAQPLISEAAMRVQWSGLFVDVAPVGTPALGAAPYPLRASAAEFAEAPFAYDVQESFHEATRLLGAGYSSGVLTVDGSVFHHAVTTGRHDRLDDGPIDSWSARVMLTPMPRLSLQASQGSLGDDKRKVSSASATYGGALAASAIWTRREVAAGEALSSLAFELTWRARRGTLMARVESVDRPAFTITPAAARRTDVTLGAIYDILRARALRTGLGANIDYHSNTHELRDQYGHKPQSVYLFVRVAER
jgi:hypothetical protein